VDLRGGASLDCGMAAEAEPPRVWMVRGSYFEACNCEAICPCRRVGERAGGRSSYGICQFALSWQISQGRADGLQLDDLAVVMAGWYDDDEPGSPWRVSLYIDERASREQHAALAAIFLGRAGGTTLRNFAAAIGTVMLSGRPASSCLTCPAAGLFGRTPISLCTPEQRLRRPPRWPAAYLASPSQGRRSSPTRSASTTLRSAGTYTVGAALPLASPTVPATDTRARTERSRCRRPGDGTAGAVARCLIDDRLPGTVPGRIFSQMGLRACGGGATRRKIGDLPRSGPEPAAGRAM